MNFFNQMGDAMMGRMRDRWNSGAGGAMFGQMGGQPQQPMGGGAGMPGMDPTGMDGMGAQATREKEALARQRGFNNYNEMILWMRQRAQPHTGSIGRPGGGGVTDTPGSNPGNNDPMAWHPRNMFNRITEAFKAATGQ